MCFTFDVYIRNQLVYWMKSSRLKSCQGAKRSYLFCLTRTNSGSTVLLKKWSKIVNVMLLIFWRISCPIWSQFDRWTYQDVFDVQTCKIVFLPRIWTLIGYLTIYHSIHNSDSRSVESLPSLFIENSPVKSTITEVLFNVWCHLQGFLCNLWLNWKANNRKIGQIIYPVI
jgi:hypothetical protein